MTDPNRVYWILAGRQPKAISDYAEWCRWFGEDSEQRRVAGTTVGENLVSTVFLPRAQHQRWVDLPPMFETMIFGSDDSEQDTELIGRCSTWEEAEQMHAHTVARLRGEHDE